MRRAPTGRWLADVRGDCNPGARLGNWGVPPPTEIAPMPWPFYIAPNEIVPASTMLADIIQICTDRQSAPGTPGTFSPYYVSIRNSAQLCLANTSHGAHGTTAPDVMYLQVSRCLTALMTLPMTLPILRKAMTEIDHTGGGGGVDK